MIDCMARSAATFYYPGRFRLSSLRESNREIMPKPKRQSPSGDTPKSGGKVPAERLADLAAASRILAAQGVVDGFGHVSMRHPSAPDRYLMARALAPALVTPKDIIE